MKKISFFKYALFFVAAIGLIGFNSCSSDDDDDNDDPPAFVEDGFYIAGAATGAATVDISAMMQAGRIEGDGFATLPRDGMYEHFMYLSAGNFHILQVAGAVRTEWGWDGSGQMDMALDGTNDQIDGTVHHGVIVADGTGFTVAEAGFYHVVLDVSTTQVFFTKINHWGVIGDATDLGWSGQWDMAQASASTESASWVATDVTLRTSGGFKFRYNSGWKISTEDFIIFANIGSENGNWVMGAGGFPAPSEEGLYTVTLNWSLENGWSYDLQKTGAVEPLPEYPDELFMIGDGLYNGGWDWSEVDMPMVPVHSNPHLFWKIVWLNETGNFEFSPVKDWNGNFGGTAIEDGISDIIPGGGVAIPVPGTAGYYMVIVNLEEEKVAVVDPKVYLIGNTIDSWDQGAEGGLFTVDNANDVLTITRDLLAGELRMYAWYDAADWFTSPLGDGTRVSWWQVEFIVLDGVIEFRGKGDDQARVNVTDGNYTINLNFKDETGSVTAN